MPLNAKVCDRVLNSISTSNKPSSCLQRNYGNKLGSGELQGSAAYFGDRDRPFRRIVTAAQRAVLRPEILVHAVTIMRFFPLVRRFGFVTA